MNYEDMIDFEINKAVAEALGHQVCVSYHAASENAIIIVNGSARPVNYCNNPSDAWPIIEREEVWEILMDGSCSDMALWYSSENKLRAAMIVFLKIQESKQLP